MKGALSYAAGVLQTGLSGADAPFVGVSTDTRRLEAGNLFVALTGERFDGHEYLARAHDGGAAGAVIARDVTIDTTLPVMRVTDTRKALGSLANAWRQNFTPKMVAITGSNGKTTVKEMLAAICAQDGLVLYNPGNYNNDIGVPLTLFGLGDDTRYAVIEMGANHPGEIGYLTDIAEPEVGVITNAAPAHLEGFGSIEGVARAKGELYRHMADDAVAIINADDDFADGWRDMAAPRRIIRFGFSRDADVRARRRGQNWQVDLSDGSFELELHLPGRHNVQNALAASAAALALGLNTKQIKAGLAAVKPVPGRQELKQSARGYTVIDDSYNANPGSLSAAVDLLIQQPGESWVVLGSMGELGAAANAIHTEAGRTLHRSGVKRLFTLGSEARFAAEAFGKGAAHFDEFDALVAALQAELHPDLYCLVKGSRSARMERVVAALLGGERASQRAGGEG